VDRVTRFGVSLPGKLVERFDRTLAALGYDNRSKAIRDALTDFMAQSSWKSGEGRFIGSISYLYDHHVGDVTSELTEAQHRFSGLIKAVMHSHVSHSECVEVLIVSGMKREITSLHNQISSTRGVESCKLDVLKEVS